MTVSKGEIWLANLNPQKRANEVGKVRPVLIIQGDALNRTDYPTVIVMPLTTQLVDDVQPLRFRIPPRQKLYELSDLLVAHIRAIDRNRLIEKLAELTENELRHVRALLDEILQ
ncbi:type II toxin-antitoxin system PemK/MazF family toxin [Nitratifractor sp.]